MSASLARVAPAPTHDRSDVELTDFAHEHLVYEARMLVYAVNRVVQLSQGPEANAYLESFAVHARCLRDFIWGKRTKHNPQDAFASDYCAPGVWEKRWPDMTIPHPIQNIDHRVRIAREVVHLSYTRLEVTRKGWRPKPVLAGIAGPLSDLADLALPERMDDATRAALRDPERFGEEAGAKSVATGGYFGGTIPVSRSTIEP